MSIWNVVGMLFLFVSAALKSTVVLGAAWLAAWALRGRSAPCGIWCGPPRPRPCWRCHFFGFVAGSARAGVRSAASV